MLRRRKGYLCALIALTTLMIMWNVIGFISEKCNPANHKPLHDLGLATAIVLAVLYRGERGSDIVKLLKNGVSLGEMLGSEMERRRPPRAFEVVARVPFQKSN